MPNHSRNGPGSSQLWWRWTRTCLEDSPTGAGPKSRSVDHPVWRVGTVRVVHDRGEDEAEAAVLPGRVVARSERCQVGVRQACDREEGRVRRRTARNRHSGRARVGSWRGAGSGWACPLADRQARPPGKQTLFSRLGPAYVQASKSLSGLTSRRLPLSKARTSRPVSSSANAMVMVRWRIASKGKAFPPACSMLLRSQLLPSGSWRENSVSIPARSLPWVLTQSRPS